VFIFDGNILIKSDQFRKSHHHLSIRPLSLYKYRVLAPFSSPCSSSPQVRIAPGPKVHSARLICPITSLTLAISLIFMKPVHDLPWHVLQKQIGATDRSFTSTNLTCSDRQRSFSHRPFHLQRSSLQVRKTCLECTLLIHFCILGIWISDKLNYYVANYPFRTVVVLWSLMKDFVKCGVTLSIGFRRDQILIWYSSKRTLVVAIDW